MLEGHCYAARTNNFYQLFPWQPFKRPSSKPNSSLHHNNNNSFTPCTELSLSLQHLFSY
jgi:hypothetical protein